MWKQTTTTITEKAHTHTRTIQGVSGNKDISVSFSFMKCMQLRQKKTRVFFILYSCKVSAFASITTLAATYRKITTFCNLVESVADETEPHIEQQKHTAQTESTNLESKKKSSKKSIQMKSNKMKQENRNEIKSN